MCVLPYLSFLRRARAASDGLRADAIWGDQSMMRVPNTSVLRLAAHPVCCRLMDSTSSAMPSYSVTLYELEHSRSTQSVTAAVKARASASEHFYKVCAV